MKDIEKITQLSNPRLSDFFIDLSDAFMDIYRDDSNRTDAKEFGKELLLFANYVRSKKRFNE